MDNIVSRETFFSIMKTVLTKEGLVYTSLFLEKMWGFFTLLKKWNQTHSLTTNISPEDFIEKQVADSLLFTKIHRVTNQQKMLDVGSGGGFPGIPLAVFYPQSNFILSDLIRKKTSFLSYSKAVLSLSNITVFTGNAMKLSGDFDYLFFKAVSADPRFLHTFSPLCGKHGKIVLFHSSNLSFENFTSFSIEEQVHNIDASSYVSILKPH